MQNQPLSGELWSMNGSGWGKLLVRAAVHESLLNEPYANLALTDYLSGLTVALMRAGFAYEWTEQQEQRRGAIRRAMVGLLDTSITSGGFGMESFG